MFLKVEGLKKIFNNTIILENINFSIDRGESVVILGENGAGKTTLLDTLVGITLPSDGEILLNGEKITKANKKKIGYVPVDPFLYDYLSGIENLEIVSDLYAIDNSRKKIKDTLDMIGLSSKDSIKLVKNYSSGMKQKLSIGMAILNAPDLLILDEPFNALDVKITFSIKEFLNNYRNTGKSILFTTHLFDTAINLADKALLLKDGIIKEQFMLEENSDIGSLEIWF